MSERDRIQAVVREATAVLAPLAISLREDENDVVADLARDGVVVWPNYAVGPDDVLATLAAEQRYLAEERGSGTVPGVTYLDKARERLLRALTT